jgi:diguanylate cyclase (GGDEF)-like protein
VSNGTDAIAALVAADGPRLAVLDWMMPGADGLAVCRAVRERTAPYAYLILLTARDRREDLMAGLAAEADDFLTKPLDIVELQARLRSGERVLRLQEGLLAAQEALQRRATHDDLTGLWNRGMILDRLAQELSRARREGTSVGVAMADLDHFKQINDTYGHAAGDDILRAVADALRGCVRGTDVVCRVGGEEFLVILPSQTAQEAEVCGHRCRQAVADRRVDVGGIEMGVTVSVGAATRRAGIGQCADLLKEADDALYVAKQSGRNCVRSSRDPTSGTSGTNGPPPAQPQVA